MRREPLSPPAQLVLEAAMGFMSVRRAEEAAKAAQVEAAARMHRLKEQHEAAEALQKRTLHALEVARSEVDELLAELAKARKRSKAAVAVGAIGRGLSLLFCFGMLGGRSQRAEPPPDPIARARARHPPFRE